MRHWLAVLLAFGIVLPAHAVRRFNYAFDQVVTEIDQASDPDTIAIAADADDTLILCTVLGELATPTISDDQDNVWETTVTQSGSGHRIACAVKCDAVTGTTTVTVDPPAGQDMLVTHLLEYSGGDTTSCVQNSAGSETASDTSPLTGATVTSTDTALIFAAAVSVVDLTMTTGTSQAEGDSASTIRLNVGDLRATSASTWNAVWTFSGTQPSLNLAIAIGEAAGGAPASPLPSIIQPRRGGGGR